MRLGISLNITRQNEVFRPARLFAATDGALYDLTDLTALYTDSAGTTPLTLPDTTIGLAADRSRARSPVTSYAALQANAGLRPKWGRAPVSRRNLLTLGGTTLLNNSDGGATIDNAPTGFTPPIDASFQRITKLAAATQFYAYRTSQVGASTGQTVMSYYVLPDAGCTEIGFHTDTNAQGRMRYNLTTGVTTLGTNTAAAGAVALGGGWYRIWAKTLGVAASMVWAVVANTATTGAAASFVVGGHQSEAASLTAFQKTASAFDMTEAGLPSYGYMRPDLSDDKLTATFPSALTGDLLIHGRSGTWRETVTIGAGGTLDIGPTGTPSTAGAIRAVGDIVGIEVIGRILSDAEVSQAVAYWRARGALGLLTAGADQASNGGFATDTIWTKGTGWTIGSGVATKTDGTASVLSEPQTLTAGLAYQIDYTITRTAGTITPRFTGGTTVTGTAQSASGTYRQVLIAATGNVTFDFSADAAFAGTVDNVTIKPLVAT